MHVYVERYPPDCIEDIRYDIHGSGLNWVLPLRGFCEHTRSPIPHEFYARRRRQRGVFFVCRKNLRYLDAIESAAKTI
jgi:hypothetical protein